VQAVTGVSGLVVSVLVLWDYRVKQVRGLVGYSHGLMDFHQDLDQAEPITFGMCAY
jgi:hypothetical protein